MCAGNLCQWLGRRKAMVGCSLGFLLAWLWLHSTDSVTGLYSAHFAAGFSVGLVSLCATAHMVEVAAAVNRGFVGGGLFVAVTAGMLYSHCLGLLLDWSWLALGCAVPALLFAAVAPFAIESPRWLLLHARRERAVQALKRIGLSGAYADREARHIEEAFTCLPPTAVNVLLVYHVMFVQQFSGIGAAPPYIAGLAQAAGVTVSPAAFAVLLSSLQLVMTVVSAAVMDVLGRRSLFLTSAAACVCSLFAVGTVSSWGRGKEPHPVALVIELALLVAYAIGYSFGLGPVTWLLAAEMIPLQGAGLLLSLAFAFNWLSLFAVTLFLDGLRGTLSFSGCGWFFSAVTLAGTSLVYWFVPETNGRSLEQILMDVNAEGE
ncbi:facilitated trehalose transporter Tret1-like [Dermacentor variabilis]|uniref:facilitated trehalose transporter Tret1-like n=1 Tax=Dermacentor variabilis TaxID=34621 RepID=UPI003F5AEC44